MSRGNNWIAMDKLLAQDFKSIKREFSRIEAMFSYSMDVDNGRNGTISGYAAQWSWSRNKVRRFLNCIRTVEGHLKDSKRTDGGHPIHFIDNALMTKKDSKRTDGGQTKDTRHDTTIEPKPKPNPKEINKEICTRLIQKINELSGKNFRLIQTNFEFITPRLNEGFTEQDCLTVITNKNIDPNFSLQYFKPETLFRKSKFEGYLNEDPTQYRSFHQQSQKPGRSEQNADACFDFANR